MDFYRKLFQKPGKSPPSLPLTYKVEIDKQKELINKFRQTSLNLEKEFLRQKSINAGSEVIQSFCSAFQEVLLDEFYLDTNEDTYADAESLWKVLSVYIDSTPINFLRGLQKFNQEKDKLNIWILVELFDKSLCSTFLILSKNPELVLRHYNANALIRKEGDQIKEILNRLMHLQYDLYSDFLQKYQEKKEQSPKSELENTNKSLEEEKEHEKEQENIDENQIKENIDRYKKLLESTKEQKQQDDRQSFIREEYKQFLDEKQEHKPFELIRKIWGPKKLRKSTRSKSKIKSLRKTSSFDDLDSKKIAPSGLLKGFFNLANKYKIKEEEHDEKKLSVSTYRKSDEKENSSISEEGNHSFRSGPKNFYATNDYSFHDKYNDKEDKIKTIYLKNVKRSEILFLQKYRRILAEFEYRDPPKKLIKAEDQEYKCFGCGAQLNRLLLTIWSRNTFCHYTGYWYCSDCMSDEKLYIPWYLKERLDFKKYHICKTARDELYKCFSKPNIAIDHASPVIRNNEVFYDTLVKKRELHLIFDMICDPIYVSDLLRNNMNLVLKINLFSLKNLVEIKNGAMLRYIEKYIDMLTFHIKGCQECQQKGVVCPLCNNNTKIFPFDIKNTSICRKCKTLYHSKCFNRKVCIVCRHNA